MLAALKTHPQVKCSRFCLTIRRLRDITALQLSGKFTPETRLQRVPCIFRQQTLTFATINDINDAARICIILVYMHNREKYATAFLSIINAGSSFQRKHSHIEAKPEACQATRYLFSRNSKLWSLNVDLIVYSWMGIFLTVHILRRFTGKTLGISFCWIGLSQQAINISLFAYACQRIVETTYNIFCKWYTDLLCCHLRLSGSLSVQPYTTWERISKNINNTYSVDLYRLY